MKCVRQYSSQYVPPKGDEFLGEMRTSSAAVRDGWVCAAALKRAVRFGPSTRADAPPRVRATLPVASAVVGALPRRTILGT